MSDQLNNQPHTIQCGFCGHDIEWGYTACQGCGATVLYGLAAGGKWAGAAHLCAFITAWLFVLVGFVAFVASLFFVHTSYGMLDGTIALSSGFLAGYGAYKVADKLTDWLVRVTGIDKYWRNKYAFTRVV